eukprot:GHVP01050767.1.p1 GENE.GHVP01050767.1~~GHVP01050767.1.p1  ORF type:complete len:394 (-),score=61.02 GHVP01050767.1:995-2176(-)
MAITRNQLPVGFNLPSNYEYKQLIGKGSYGEVAEAVDRRSGKVLAVKRVFHVFDDLVDCKRILREIAILSRLRHQNIVRLENVLPPADVFNFDELYEVMEIADSDMKKLCKTSVFLNEEHVMTLMYNLLVGLKHIHDAGIYHRDLKPANCLINQDCTVKICDFGLARTVNDRTEEILEEAPPPEQNENNAERIVVPATERSKRVMTHHVVTRWYRAPEIILLQENYNEKIDIWSVGCIFAELMGMLKENCAEPSDRSPLFPGQSSFPLSPRRSSQGSSSRSRQQDQLAYIFRVLGTPEDTSWLERPDAITYIKNFDSKPAIDLKDKFPGSSPEAVDLLKKLIQFNPANRYSVHQALAHPFFQTIRNASTEGPTPRKLEVSFDDWKMLWGDCDQ